MQRPPFRFAVQAANAASGAQWCSLARQVEDLGYSTLFVPDHYLGPGPAQRSAHTPRQDLAPIAAMTAAAMSTSTLRIGSRVFCVDYHVPAVLAKEAVTLDLLSDGRLELGLGAGWSDGEYGAMGLEFARGGKRLAKLAEVVDLVKAHCTDAELACRGEFVNVGGYRGTPTSVQRPHPPIMIGGARQRMLCYAGAEADIVSISNVPFAQRNEAGLTPEQEAQRRVGWVREAAGRRFARLDVESSPYFTVITDDPDTALAAVAERTGGSIEQLAEHPNVLIGPVEAVVEKLQARRTAVGVNYVTVQQDQVESFAPVVAALAGS
jgi:probable F420-dependent oxidoreductase